MISQSKLSQYKIADAPGVEVYAFGGYEEAGRNCFALRSTVLKKTWLKDVGFMILRRHEEDDTPSNESQTLPAFEAVAELWLEVSGIFVTHIHLDHCGGLPALYKMMAKLYPRHKPPILASPLVVSFIKSLFVAARQPMPTFYEVETDKRLRYDGLEFTAIAVPHSTPQTRSFLFYLPTPYGGVTKFLFVSDFKFADCKLTRGISEKFVATLKREAPIDILMYDALYKNRRGFAANGMTPSEDIVEQGLEEMLARAPRSLILSFFASNYHRLEMVYDRVKEKYLFCYKGRSMKRMVEFAREGGWLADPDGYQEGPEVLLRPSVMVATGSQAEPYAVLTRMSQGELDVREDDSFGIMADPIPGNEDAMRAMIQGLACRCPKGFVFIGPYTAKMIRLSKFHDEYPNIVVLPNLHASGHGSEGDHELLRELCRAHIEIQYHFPVKADPNVILPD